MRNLINAPFHCSITQEENRFMAFVKLSMSLKNTKEHLKKKSEMRNDTWTTTGLIDMFQLKGGLKKKGITFSFYFCFCWAISSLHWRMLYVPDASSSQQNTIFQDANVICIWNACAEVFLRTFSFSSEQITIHKLT